MKYPIIVSKADHIGEKEKFYRIYCLAPYLNAFNEVIEVRYREAGYNPRKFEWQVSKGSSGSQDLEGCQLIAKGYQIAIELMSGNEGVVTPKAIVDKFHKAYDAKLKRREKARWEARRKQA